MKHVKRKWFIIQLVFAFMLIGGLGRFEVLASGTSTSQWYNLKIENDQNIPMRDGAQLSANIFRPDASGKFPVIITMGPYRKDTHFSDWDSEAYEEVAEQGPYMHWETVNPEWWIPQGYVQIRVDQRGTGKSPGKVDLFSEQQNQDFYDAIEWAAQQPWSNGKVGILGISFYAISAWQVAAMQPPHLAAIIPWEGVSDLYQDAFYHGGILSSTFLDGWFHERIVGSQYSEGKPKSEAELAQARVHLPDVVRAHPTATTIPESWKVDFDKIEIPVLSAGNWGGLGLHMRGNIVGYEKTASSTKRLEMHTGKHYTHFYSEEGRAIQKQFFDHWLKGIDNGLLQEPPVKIAVRKGNDYSWRYENEWPIARTQWKRYYLDANQKQLLPSNIEQKAKVQYSAEPEATVSHVEFLTEAFAEDTEITGHIKLKLWVSSSVDDADLFVTVKNIDPEGNVVYVDGANNPNTPVSQGWLRISHRKLDPKHSTDWLPVLTHDEIQKLTPNQVVPVEIEVWPTSMVFEKGHRLALSIGSKDGKGSRPFMHMDSNERNQKGMQTIHTGGSWDSYLLLPIIPNQ